MKKHLSLTSIIVNTKSLRIGIGLFIVALSLPQKSNAQHPIPGTTAGCSSYDGITSSTASANLCGINGGNSAFGWNAMNKMNNLGSYNTGVGTQSLFNNEGGSSNVGTGAWSLFNNVSGNHNTANGYRALYYNLGSNNVATGSDALYSNTSGRDNTAAGFNSLNKNTTGAYNTAVGSQALYSSTTSNRNTAYGWQAMYSNTVSEHNIGLGFRSLYNNTTGSFNATLGSAALSVNTTGSQNTGLGVYSEVSSNNLSNSTALGYATVVNASNKVRIGNATVTVIEGQVAFTSISDGRFKTNVNENDVKGLEFIKKLRPVVYNLDNKKFTEFLTKNMPDSLRKIHLSQDFTHSSNIRQSGFIAQEVETAAKEVNYDFNGVHVPESENDNYGLAYSEFVVPLVKGMQEQQKMIEDQKLLIEGLQQQLNELQKITTTIGKHQPSTSLIDASMEQNIPNPFSRETIINFNLPEQINSSYLVVYDLVGKEIKTISIGQRGKSSITITSDQLEAGMYIYSLFADGKIVDSKRMVISK